MQTQTTDTENSTITAPDTPLYDAVVVGGGPAGATAAERLARRGLSVALLDRAGRIKPCGGAIPPQLLKDFDIPEHLLVARARSARIVAPSSRQVDMPIEGGFVGMVDRDVFDEWLRTRAADAGAVRLTGRFRALERDAEGTTICVYTDADDMVRRIRARRLIGADGANSAVAKAAMPKQGAPKSVFAYHEIVRIGSEDGSPSRLPVAQNGEAYSDTRCDIHYRGDLSPDFYSWVFPHGATASVGTGTAVKGFSLRQSVKTLREISGLDTAETLREEGAPIPLKPLKRWDNGQDIILAGDAAGVVAPASGEGIYYAMTAADMVADAVAASLEQNNPALLRTARKRFMKAHGKVFWVLGILQSFWYSSDNRRERFTTMCADPDVQRLTWQAYMHKRLVKADPGAHMRIFLKDLAHLVGWVAPYQDHDKTGKTHS